MVLPVSAAMGLGRSTTTVLMLFSVYVSRSSHWFFCKKTNVLVCNGSFSLLSHAQGPFFMAQWFDRHKHVFSTSVQFVPGLEAGVTEGQLAMFAVLIVWPAVGALYHAVVGAPFA